MIQGILHGGNPIGITPRVYAYQLDFYIIFMQLKHIKASRKLSFHWTSDIIHVASYLMYA